MKYFSLISGVGGFELAIGNKGECVGFSEIDKYAISVYNYHFPNHKSYGDISKIDWKTVPDFDLVVGGSPCQDLSVAGKQKGLSGERSGLFFEFVRCLKEKQPTNFIWENVKGALSSSSGWDFARVQIEFSEAGYDVEWQVLNAKDFGVPQNRERVFVVGHLRGKSGPKVFPIRTHSTKNDGIQPKKNRQGTRVPCLNTRYGQRWSGEGYIGIRQINNPTHSNDRVYSDDGISPSLEGDYAFTVDSANTGGVSVDTRIRRLTPLECERLMSWPDDWTKTGAVGTFNYQNSGLHPIITQEISDTQRYKMCGNGVVSKVVEAIVEKLYFIDQISQSINKSK